MFETKEWKGNLDGVGVELLIQTKLEFDGITLSPVGSPKIYGKTFVNGKPRVVGDVRERFGDEIIRKIIQQVQA